MPTATLTADGDTTAAATTTNTGSSTLDAESEAGAQAETLSASTETTVPATPEEVAGMAAGTWHLHIEQGATFAQTYTTKADDGSPYDWTGWAARAQIRSAPADTGTLLLDLTPYLTVDVSAIQLLIPATITQTLTRNGVWDLEMTLGATVVRLLNGRATVSLEVTRE